VLGAGSGVKIVQEQQRLLVVDTGTSALTVAAFVLGLLTLIPGGFGAAMLAVGQIAVGLGFVGAAALFGAGLVLALRTLRRRRSRPLGELTASLVIDLAARTLCDGCGRVLAPLDRVRFRRKFQIGSSSPALVAAHDGRERLIARGNPFAGGLGTLEDALRRHRLL